jgi:hypothetical protein
VTGLAWLSLRETLGSNVSSRLNFVEVFHIPNPDSIYKETRNEEGAEDEADDDSGLLVEKCKEGEVADSQQEHQAAIKEPLPSAVTYEELRKAAARDDMAEATRLAFKMSEQASAERQAQARAAEEERLRSEDSSDEVHADDFADQIRITIGGRPAKTTSLTMKDLIRRDTEIEKVDYVSRKDGTHQSIFYRLRFAMGPEPGIRLFDLAGPRRGVRNNSITSTTYQRFCTNMSRFPTSIARCLRTG